jgi:hypothetical protein
MSSSQKTTRNYTVKEHSYQLGCHGKCGGGAVYKNEEEHGKPYKERENWLPSAIERFRTRTDVECLSYNKNHHSVYLYSKEKPSLFINDDTYIAKYTEVNKYINKNNIASRRHYHHVFISFANEH